MRKTLKIYFHRNRKYLRTKINSSVFTVSDAEYDLGPYYINMLESLDFPLTITFSLRRVKPSIERRMIKKIIAERKTEFETSINHKTGGKSTLKKHVEDAERILHELDSENSRIFDTSLCIKISSDHPVGLKERSDRLVETLGYLGMETTSEPHWLETRPFTSMQKLKGTKYLMNSKAISQIIPLYFTPRETTDGVFIGVDDLNEKPVFMNPFNENSHNILVIGETGSGKSFFVKLIMHRLLVNNVCTKFFVFDPLNEYPPSLFKGKASIVEITKHGEVLTQKQLNGYSGLENEENVMERKEIIIARFQAADDFTEEAMKSFLGIANSFMNSGDDRKMLIFDECHIITSIPSGFQGLSSMVRHSRHFNASIVNISQNVDDFLRKDLASIAYNSNRIFVFRTRSMRDEHRNILKLEDFDISPPETLLGGKSDSYSECIVSSGQDVKKLRVLSTTAEMVSLSG